MIEWLSIPFHLFAHARAHGLAINNAKATTFLTHFVFFFIFSSSLFSHTFSNSPLHVSGAHLQKYKYNFIFSSLFFVLLFVCVYRVNNSLSLSVCIRGWGIFLRVCAFVIFAAIVSIVLAVFCSGLFPFIGYKFALSNVKMKTLINVYWNKYVCLFF